MAAVAREGRASEGGVDRAAVVTVDRVNVGVEDRVAAAMA